MRSRTFKTRLLAAALAIFSSCAAMGQETGTLGTLVGELVDRIEISGYAHAGYAYQDDGGSTTSSFNLKRALIWGKAKITERASFLFMHDFSSEVMEYYVDYRFSKGKQFNAKFGQYKHCFSIENPMSPRFTELVNVYSLSVACLAGGGGDPIYGTNYGRDIGITFYGDLFNDKFHYEVALMNGQGINCSDGNSDKDIVAKLAYKPIPQLTIAVSGRKGRGHAVGTADWNPDIEIGDNYRRDRLSAGAAFANNRWGLRGEYLWGRDGSVTSQGAYLTGRLTVAKNWDVVASVDYFDRNIDMDYDQTNLVAGVQYWYFKNCRLQLQYTRAFRQFSDNYNMLQAQIQVAF